MPNNEKQECLNHQCIMCYNDECTDLYEVWNGCVAKLDYFTEFVSEYEENEWDEDDTL